jgi:hypothetical protein
MMFDVRKNNSLIVLKNINMIAKQSSVSRHKNLLRLCARIGYSPPQAIHL